MNIKIGALWLWRGNYYDAIGSDGDTVHLREHGSGLMFTQTWTPEYGWAEPCAS